MNFMRNVFIFIACVLSFGVSAAQQCTFNAESDFEFTASLTASEFDDTVEIIAKNPNIGEDGFTLNGGKPIWSNKNSSDAAITDTQLVNNTNYTLGFSFKFNSNSGTEAVDGYLTYYRKAEGQDWEQITTDKFIRIARTTEFTINHGELNCDGSPTEVPDVPEVDFDVCDYFPGALQSNYYPAGAPFGGLMTNGGGTQIILPDDDYEMSFGSYQGFGDCVYPSSEGYCKTTTTPISGYPLPLSDNFTGLDLTIPAETTHTLPSGEYWFDTLTFGGDNSKLEITGKVILHYKKMVIPDTGKETNFYINEGGNVQDLMIFGHGSNASIAINDGMSASATMNAVANFYIDPLSGGFSIAGDGSYINGSISAQNVSISGSGVTINTAGTCVDPNPAPSEPEIDICDYFPEPAQSWKSAAALNIDNAHQQLIGWSDNYISNHLFKAMDTDNDGAVDSVSTVQCTTGDSGCALQVGFDTITYNGRNVENMACGEGACISGGEKIEVPPSIEPEFTSTKEITIDDWASRDQCVDGGMTYCTVTDEGSGSYTINILKSLKSLTVNAWSSANFNIIFKTDTDDAKYGLKIESVLLAGNTSNLVAGFVGDTSSNGDARFTFGQATITSGQISATGQVILFLTQGLEVTNPFLTALDNPDSDFMIYGPEAKVDFAGDGQEMRLKILANSVTFHNSAAIYGAVTANTLELSESNTYIIADEGMCSSTTTDDNYAITITPEIDYSLMCGTDQPTFTVTTQKNGQDTTLGVNAEILPSENSDDFKVEVKNGVGSGSFPSFLSDSDGHLELGIAIKRAQNVELNKEYTLKVELVSDSSLTASGKFIYVPFKFKADDQLVIAGKPEPVNVSVVGCSDTDKTETLISNYSGKPDISYNLNQPSTGVGRLTFAPELEDGVTTSDTQDLTFDNSGVVNVYLDDPDFDCSGFEDCPIDGNGTLKGNFVVNARPWTFAICEPSGNTMSGDSNGGSGFVAAGEAFNLQVKPIVWQAGGSETASVEVSSYCHADVTTNFFITEAPSATINMMSELETPVNGRLGSGITSDDTLDRQHDEVNHSGDGFYTYNNLVWQEVGSLKVSTDTVANYLGMDINLGYRNIGRFYPHHLMHKDNEWGYASGHHDFAYMDQPITMEYIIEAQSQSNSVTWNYGLFAPNLQDELGLAAINTTNNQSLLSRLIYSEQSSNGWSEQLTADEASKRNGQYQVNYDDFEFLKKISNNPHNFYYTTIPDGPYDLSNAEFGVVVTQKVDGVDFDFDNIESDEKISLDVNGDGITDEGVSFDEQPDFRYGRMALDSVSVAAGELVQVPLRTEYWDGESYIQNFDDDGSHFITNQYCVSSNLSNSDAYFTDTNSGNTKQTVNTGGSDIVRAGQVTPQKEIARIFLRQGITDPSGVSCGWADGDQPWLQFNWRDYGDEDPSAVVVFGAYRGNDRVIYRGEPELIAN